MDYGVWVFNNILENVIVRFYCNMGYRENSMCRLMICKNGRWENYQLCLCKEILIVFFLLFIYIIFIGRILFFVIFRDDLLLLCFIFDKLQLMWIIVGMGVFVVVIIVFIMVLVLCFKFWYEMIFLCCLDNVCYFINGNFLQQLLYFIYIVICLNII